MRVVAIVLLAVVAVFFGRDVVLSLGVCSAIDDLQEQRGKLLRSIAEDSIMLQSLDDPEFLERYARENFLMRRDSETVYILMEK